MPTSFRARQSAIVSGADAAVVADHGRLADLIRLLLLQASVAGTLPNTRRFRESVTAAIWERVLRPYYIGAGNEALMGIVPQSTYAKRLVDGVRAAVSLRVSQQIALVRRSIRDADLVAWLTGPRPIEAFAVAPADASAMPTLMPSFAQWRDPRGYVLSDRILRMAVDVRSRVSRFVDYHASAGTEVATAGNELAQFLTTGQRQRRPYGQQGAYPARFLVRNELIVAGGWATINASQVNPAVGGIKWVLTRQDTDRDQCDLNARGGPNGDGVYPPGGVPRWPDHVGEACDLVPVPAAAPTAAMRQAVAERSEYGQAIRGLLNQGWLTDALLSGAFEVAAEPARERV